MNQRAITIAIIVTVIFIGGIWFALLLPNRFNNSQDEQGIGGGASEPLFTDMRVGTVVRESFAKQKHPPIKQKSEYTTKELLMLQGTTAKSVLDPVTVSVRLVDSLQSIIPLSPDEVTLEPGTNEYCCWKIEREGAYTMEIIRPDNIITRIPLKITPATGQ